MSKTLARKAERMMFTGRGAQINLLLIYEILINSAGQFQENLTFHEA